MVVLWKRNLRGSIERTLSSLYISEKLVPGYYQNSAKFKPHCKMGKEIQFNLRVTSPEGVVMKFKTIHEAAEGLGFSLMGVWKVCKAGRNGLGEYELQWLKVDEDRMAKIIRNAKLQKDCFCCGKPLTKEDKSRLWILLI